MGICFGWLSRGNLLSHQNPPPLDREETYKDCKIYFHESHEKADQLQQKFANKVIQSIRNIEKAKKKAEEELRKSKKTKPLKDKEAEEIVKNIQKENDWLKRSRNTITDVLSKLNDVNEHESRFMGEQPNQTNYDTLIGKLKTDVMTLINLRIKQITTSPSCTSLDAPSIDSETDEPSEKSSNSSGISSKHVSEIEANHGVGSDDTCDIDERQGRPDRHKRQMQDFILLYECALILKTVQDDFSKIYLLIKGKMCKVKI
ncbi:histone-binding protein N1/N2-like [Mytilus edulis]|uniref:histone-binding protein N1/N2-like n=1 Tax=Mytilus edulis TaxID=6550 RepID=UPI0039EE2723